MSRIDKSGKVFYMKEWVLVVGVNRLAHGTPLALKILGAKLYSKCIEEWKSEVEKVNKFDEPKISHILKSSFDGLDKLQKHIFLDVVCFFKGESKEVEKILSCLYKGAVSGLSNLLDKCLFDINSYGRISMHDMLEEMGKDIVDQESKYPEKRKRLWNPKDVYQVLNNNKGTVRTEGINFGMYQVDNSQLSPTCFENMSNLRYVKSEVTWSWTEKPPTNGVDIDIVYLPNELRYLEWSYYPFKSLPLNFNPKNLVVLKLQDGNMEQLWNEDFQDLVNLREIDVSFSKKLRKIPNLLGAINLKSLDCSWCESSVEISELPNMLHYLNLSFTRIEKVPDSIEHLETLDLSCCPIAKFSKTPRNLRELRMTECNSLKSLSELPPDLMYLNANDCMSLESVSFTDRTFHSFGGESDLFMVFSNCFSLNQDSIDNIEANAMLNIQSLSEKWASRYYKEFSPDPLPKLICCFLGNKISANRFENHSMNSSLNLKIAPSGRSGSRVRQW
ncbi:disease resistance-like protein DSC1 [Hibiscus syriacus]|uniref:disease resistance-like protein DSC1 n=1 Tax=Hibiscus syriacus TaxID=106335 RepID=UPI001920B785|nr:disease resistance-like protein DSC1 [Hibiscus syriacus]